MTTRPIKVLWIEDSADDVDIFKMAFRRAEAHLDLEVKEDGQEAVDHLSRIRNSPSQYPDFILLDLNLPKRGGREVLAHIKQTDGIRAIPVIVLTTSSADSDLLYAYELGAACYLIKPADFTDVVSLARSLHEFWSRVHFAPRQ